MVHYPLLLDIVRRLEQVLDVLGNGLNSLDRAVVGKDLLTDIVRP